MNPVHIGCRYEWRENFKCAQHVPESFGFKATAGTRGVIFLTVYSPPDRNDAAAYCKTPKAALALAPNFTTTIQRPTLLGWALSFLRNPHQAGLSAILRV